MHNAIVSTLSFRSVVGLAVLTLLVSLPFGSLEAAVFTTGDVVPSNPATWAANTPVSIAKTANGSATVNGGSTVTTGLVDVASTFGVTGTLNVDGPGSTWNVGNLGLVRVATSSLPDNFAGGTGTVNITNGGTLNAKAIIGAAFNTTGSLTITNGGRLTLDATLGDSNKSIGLMTVDGIGSSVGRNVSAGEKGNALLKVLNGATISSTTGSVARYDTSTSRAIVDGLGSRWTMGQLSVGGGMANNGSGGVGLLTVSNGATLSNTRPAELGFRTGGTGTVMVNGAGSTWTSIVAPGSCSQPDPVCGVNIGVQGTGRVSVSDGATLTTNALGITNKSTLTVDLGTGSTVSVSGSTGALTNDGTIRLAAKATAANGTYAPITAGTWNGSGTVQALGGVYNPTTHSVTVSSAATGQAGVATTIDTSVTQRMLITDSATGQQVSASFQATQSPSNISLIASLMGPSQLSLLQGLLDPGKAVLGAWNFSATGYTQGDPVYLSLQVGGGQKFYDLDVWHFDGTGWAKYLNTDLAYDNKFASFVANGFSGYAISGLAAVPVPAAVWLFGTGIAALVGLARRNALMKGDTHT